MVTKNNTRSHLFSILLGLAIVFPSLVQFQHLFEDHDHPVCDEVSTHLHGDELDCPIQDFHFTAFNFEPLTYPEFTISVEERIYIGLNTCAAVVRHIKTPQLRGPPQFS